MNVLEVSYFLLYGTKNLLYASATLSVGGSQARVNVVCSDVIQ